MSIPVIAFFNNKGGVGKTTMVYHLAWMFSDRGLRVIAADLDPQSNLTAAFLDEDRLEEVMPGDGHALTIFGAVEPLKQGTGDIADPHVEIISDRLGLILGDMALSTFEDDLSEVWPKCLDRDPRAFRITSAFWRLVQTGRPKAWGRRHPYRSRPQPRCYQSRRSHCFGLRGDPAWARPLLPSGSSKPWPRSPEVARRMDRRLEQEPCPQPCSCPG